MITKYYTILNPADSYTYKIYPDGLNDKCKITIECHKGSSEPVIYKIKENVLSIITPIWTVNPEYIKVAVEQPIEFQVSGTTYYFYESDRQEQNEWLRNLRK